MGFFSKKVNYISKKILISKIIDQTNSRGRGQFEKLNPDDGSQIFIFRTVLSFYKQAEKKGESTTLT